MGNGHSTYVMCDVCAFCMCGARFVCFHRLIRTGAALWTQKKRKIHLKWESFNLWKTHSETNGEKNDGTLWLECRIPLSQNWNSCMPAHTTEPDTEISQKYDMPGMVGWNWIFLLLYSIRWQCWLFDLYFGLFISFSSKFVGKNRCLFIQF